MDFAIGSAVGFLVCMRVINSRAYKVREFNNMMQESLVKCRQNNFIEDWHARQYGRSQDRSPQQYGQYGYSQREYDQRHYRGYGNG